MAEGFAVGFQKQIRATKRNKWVTDFLTSNGPQPKLNPSIMGILFCSDRLVGFVIQ